MRITEYPSVLVDGWTVHEAMRRLGFRADDIFFECACDALAGGAPSLFVVLRAQGKSFAVTLGPLGDLTPKTMLTFWKSFCEDIKTFPEVDLQRAYDTGLVGRLGRAALLMGILEKGFWLPRGTN